MDLFIFAPFHARAGSEDAVAGAVFDTAKEPGCLSIHAFRSVRDPRLFYIHSRSRDEAAFEYHAGLPHTVQLHRACDPIDRPPSRRHPVGTDSLGRTRPSAGARPRSREPDRGIVRAAPLTARRSDRVARLVGSVSGAHRRGVAGGRRPRHVRRARPSGLDLDPLLAALRVHEARGVGRLARSSNSERAKPLAFPSLAHLRQKSD